MNLNLAQTILLAVFVSISITSILVLTLKGVWWTWQKLGEKIKQHLH